MVTDDYQDNDFCGYKVVPINQTPTPKKSKLNTAGIIGITFASIAIIIGIAFAVIFFTRKKKEKRPNVNPKSLLDIRSGLSPEYNK